MSFDPNGGTWADGGTDVREYEAGLETEFEVIGAISGYRSAKAK